MGHGKCSETANMANTQNLKPWPKGVSGNPSGRPRRKYLTDLVEELLHEKCIDDPNTRQQLKDALWKNLCSAKVGGQHDA